MKLAISGKGGVGKTTVSALLAQAYADAGRHVLAADADPSPCLAGALGFPAELRKQLRPIAEMDELIEERTGAKPGTRGGFFTINPRVDDIPDRFSVTYRGVQRARDGFGRSGRIGLHLPGKRDAQDAVHASALPQRGCVDSGYVCRGGASGPGHGGLCRCDDHRGRADAPQSGHCRADQADWRRTLASRASGWWATKCAMPMRNCSCGMKRRTSPCWDFFRQT